MIVENRKPVVDLWGEEVIEPRHLEHRSSPVVIIDEDERQLPQDLQIVSHQDAQALTITMPDMSSVVIVPPLRPGPDISIGSVR